MVSTLRVQRYRSLLSFYCTRWNFELTLSRTCRNFHLIVSVSMVCSDDILQKPLKHYTAESESHSVLTTMSISWSPLAVTNLTSLFWKKLLWLWLYSIDNVKLSSWLADFIFGLWKRPLIDSLKKWTVHETLAFEIAVIKMGVVNVKLLRFWLDCRILNCSVGNTCQSCIVGKRMRRP
ncbi:hypothetical protein T4C_2637 [Trichinella pseudospiralis]|uniref:Uncharacterized protein n=1 Tax=Trichinella pseudospiralis TaxID=6337 RepID=A0A0V1KA66_TRIPS|nr:hypothetical protein T4C_2637 [Trichinella pseudospiralis]